MFLPPHLLSCVTFEIVLFSFTYKQCHKLTRPNVNAGLAERPPESSIVNFLVLGFIMSEPHALITTLSAHNMIKNVSVNI